MAAQQSYKIQGMDCADCARTITNGVSKFPGVKNVEVDFIGGTLKFEGEVDTESVRQRIEALVYRMARPDMQAQPAPVAENGIIAFARYLLGESETRLA